MVFDPNGQPTFATLRSLGMVALSADIRNYNPRPAGDRQFPDDARGRATVLKLMFPAVPVGAVIDTKSRLMWLTDIPKLYPLIFPDGSSDDVIRPYVNVIDDPTYGFTKGPHSGLSFNGLPDWTSPTLPVMQGLISGWSGGNPMSWLIDQSKAVAPDSPISNGFFNIIACDDGGFYSYVWTATNQGSSGSNYSPYALMDMRNGSVPAKNTTPYNSPGNWLMLTRSLAQGEQYYWYP